MHLGIKINELYFVLLSVLLPLDKVLPLGKAQINLAFPSLNRTFAAFKCIEIKKYRYIKWNTTSERLNRNGRKDGSR